MRRDADLLSPAVILAYEGDLSAKLGPIDLPLARNSDSRYAFIDDVHMERGAAREIMLHLGFGDVALGVAELIDLRFDPPIDK